MPYNFAADSFHTNFAAHFLRAKSIFIRKRKLVAFEAPFGGLGAGYDVDHRLIGKRVVDFLLVIIGLFR